MLKTVARHLRVAIGTVLPLIACLPMAVVTQQFEGTSKRTGRQQSWKGEGFHGVRIKFYERLRCGNNWPSCF